MLTFIIEVTILCISFTISCMSQVDRVMNDLERTKLNYPEPIIQRFIDQGRVSGDRLLTLAQRIRKKWPIMIAFGIIIGLIVRYINGCTTFISGFGVAYLIWTIVDWYDAFILDCVWFCHSKRCVVPGTEDLVDAYHDYMFRIKGSAVGMLIGLPCCVIAGVMAMILG